MTYGCTTVSSSNLERLTIGLQSTVGRQATSQGCWPLHGTGTKASAPSCKQAMSSRNGSFLSMVNTCAYDWPTLHNRNQRWSMTFSSVFGLRTGPFSFPTNCGKVNLRQPNFTPAWLIPTTPRRSHRATKPSTALTYRGATSRTHRTSMSTWSLASCSPVGARERLAWTVIRSGFLSW